MILYLPLSLPVMVPKMFYRHMQKSVPKEKVVQVYEKLFAGQDITSGRADFWNDFFLLRVNVKALISYFEKLSNDQITDLKPHLNRLYGECMSQASNTNHWLRIAGALQTADCLIVGAFLKKQNEPPIEKPLQVLIPSERCISSKTEYVNLCTASFMNDWPPLLQELIINSLTLRCVASDTLSENPFIEWLVDETLFELLGSLITTPCLRGRFGVGACRLLGIISQYRRTDIKNSFISKLAHLKDEILLNSISVVISYAISELTRKYSEHLNASTGLLYSISNLLGNLKVGDGQKQDLSLHDGLLLCLYVIILHNPRFPALLICSHTHNSIHSKSLDASPRSSSGSFLESESDSANENFAPSQLMLHPRNLLADLIEYSSVVMQGFRGNPICINTCCLCFMIMSQATKNPMVCCFLHEYNIHFTIQLHRARLRHRKSTVSLLDRSSANSMAAVLLDLLVEFFATHLMKSFPYEIHGHCLDICFHLLSHQKEHNIRLDYDWRQLWKALFDLMKFITKPGGLPVSSETFRILQKIVGILNFFVTFGDCFLLGPSTYDELYYELIRMADTVKCLHKFTTQHIDADGEWLSSATDLLVSIENLWVIINHFDAKFSAFTKSGGFTSLTESQVFSVILAHYDDLTLRMFDDLHKHYETCPDADTDYLNGNMISGIVRNIRRLCLDSATAFQSRFAELSVIN